MSKARGLIVESLSSVYQFDGVSVIENGFSDQNCEALNGFANFAAVFITTPTMENLESTANFLEQKPHVTAFLNSNPIKTPKPENRLEVVSTIRKSNMKFHSPSSFISNIRYTPIVIFQSISKGTLSFYVLAGDSKNAEVMTKALASGDPKEIEKASIENGTIGVLLWRPAESAKPVIRVLLSGAAPLSRVQQSLDRAARHLPFLSSPIVSSKDVFNSIRTPSSATSRSTASRSGSVSTQVSRSAAPTNRAPPVRPTASRQITRAPKAPECAKAVASQPKPRIPAREPKKAPIPTRSSAPVPKPSEVKKMQKPTSLTLEAHHRTQPKKNIPTLRISSPTPPQKIEQNSTINLEDDDSVICVGDNSKETTGTPQPTLTEIHDGTIGDGRSIIESKPYGPLASTNLTKEFQNINLNQDAEEYVKQEAEIINEAPENEPMKMEGIVENNDEDPKLKGALETFSEEKLNAEPPASISSDSPTLHMPSTRGVRPAARPIKFAHPYYFEMASMPKIEKIEEIEEYMSNIRCRNLVLQTENMTMQQWTAILTGKQKWVDSSFPCMCIPTHSTEVFWEFRAEHEQRLPTIHLDFQLPISNQDNTDEDAPSSAPKLHFARFSLE